MGYVKYLTPPEHVAIMHVNGRRTPDANSSSILR